MRFAPPKRTCQIDPNGKVALALQKTFTGAVFITGGRPGTQELCSGSEHQGIPPEKCLVEINARRILSTGSETHLKYHTPRVILQCMHVFARLTELPEGSCGLFGFLVSGTRLRWSSDSLAALALIFERCGEEAFARSCDPSKAVPFIAVEAKHMRLWVKYRVTPKWLALVNGNMD